jgi:hypothetical protein
MVAQDSRFRISKKEHADWEELKKTIEDDVKTRDTIHRAWEEAKTKDNRIKQDNKNKKPHEKINADKEKTFLQKQGEAYHQACDRMDAYNRLDNKLHLVHLNRLHHLVIELLGRMAGFTSLFERDFRYLSLAKKVENEIGKLNFPRSIPNKRELKENGQFAYLESVFLWKDYDQVRNHIAHFNYLTQHGDAESSYSIMDLINLLRDLLHYDRKLKNAVSKSFIELFDRHGMALKLKMDATHCLEVEQLKSKRLYHLPESRTRMKKEKEHRRSTITQAIRYLPNFARCAANY